jgi:nucleoid-associated protein YgaU
MTRIISALLILFSSVALVAQSAAQSATAPLELAPNAPQRHVVVRGDTLWDISAEFLKDSFRWPELWGLNKDQIKNPHWIYPGQVLVLDFIDGQPRLRIEGEGGGSGGVPTVKLQPRVRVTDGTREIPAIPQQVIEPFLSQPLVAEDEAIEGTPRIVATQDNHVFAGTGELAYATGIKSGAARQWQIYRTGKVLKDPVTKEVLGNEAVLLGTANLIKEGEPATLRVVSTHQEVGKNDRLMPVPPLDIINYPMHKPTAEINSHIVSIYGDSNAGGKYSIVAISGGQKNGLEVGHVLALSRTGPIVVDRYKGHKQEITLPNERLGLLYVFRTFQKVSYALVMDATQPVVIGDTVGTP